MMPEVLTESFCERCGTRYTFESAAPRKIRRLGGFKTLSKGLKNYVLSDETSMDEAMALARGDQEREATAQQLDAFHATFNFCMNCRQYTCGNCWNQAEGRCLTCSPLGEATFEAPSPDEAPFGPIGITADAWPTADLPPEPVVADHGGNGSNLIGVEHVPAEPIAAEAVAAEPDAVEPIAAMPVAAEPVAPELVAAEPVAAPAADLWPVEDDDPGAHFSFLRVDPDPAEAVASDAVVADVVADEIAQPAALASEPADVQAPPASARSVQPLPDGLEERASDLATRTSKLLGRFRPGQNIDAELEAFEAAFDGAPTAPAKTEGDGAAEAAASVEVPADEVPVALSAETLLELAGEPEAPEPEPIVAAPAPEPEPIAASTAPEPKPQPTAPPAEPTREDNVPQPTWRIFAPDQTAPGGVPSVEVPVSPPAAPTNSPFASAEPQWPVQPALEDSPSMALLANSARSSSDALWAASSREVLATPVPIPGPATVSAGVQPCSSCGLSLSATARFCRRCGTRQG
jgi:hypothetical protein